MTLLELVKTTFGRCEGDPNAIVTAQSQTGESLRFVNWVQDAWLDIQLSNTNWEWMVGDFSFQTQANVIEYVSTAIVPTRFADWRPRTFRLFLTSAGVNDDTFLPESGWDDFRDLYMFGVQSPGKPSEFSVRKRNRNLLLGSVPNAIYTCYGEYRKSAQSLALDLDVPEMPSDYHMAIVHKARMKYAAYENAAEVFAEATADYDMYMSRLSEAHIESGGLGSPLA